MTIEDRGSAMLAAAEAWGDLESLIEEPGVDALAAELDLIMRTEAVLGEAKAAVTTELAARMDSDTYVASGIGKLTRKPRFATWREHGKDDLRSALASSVAAEVSTSELTGERDPLAHRAAALAVEKVLGLIYWSGAAASAKRLHTPINPAEYKGGVTGYTVSLTPEEEL